MYRQICQNSHSRARCEVIFHTRKLLFAFYSHERPAAIFTNQKSTVAYHGRNIVIERRKDTESMLNRPFVRNKSATHGKKTYDRMITVLRETEERARVIVNNEERLVTVRLAGREYIKQRGVERSLALVAGPDVSATSIDM
ncbi:hypothetical protein ALC60_02997 [Trachymyrmex zeteki]|uniref:Uncharacterized protein n=1 Tax=Mycetomoellerius zeteki TaxID=64791 RepID=A0A151XCC6_9HYME|nr:hypothetical protein ALC60_02997 [Trachymyrmex zeteki]